MYFEIKDCQGHPQNCSVNDFHWTVIIDMNETHHSYKSPLSSVMLFGQR